MKSSIALSWLSDPIQQPALLEAWMLGFMVKN
jgi:hypothetical protein